MSHRCPGCGADHPYKTMAGTTQEIECLKTQLAQERAVTWALVTMLSSLGVRAADISAVAGAARKSV